ncbi:MAG: SspB family protein [Propylenella sp.]
MVDDLIRYDVLYQEALLGLVKKVLSEVARAGLPGEHHFYVTFDTRASGVRISSRLRADYPSEMTVVLQHQFWDLTVTDSGFEVGLSFKGVPERLVVPFRAVKSFADPHAHFQVKFDVKPEAEAQAAAEGAPAEEAAAAPAKKTAVPAAGKKAAASGKAGKAAAADGKADVVSLDSFRKKS